MASGTKVNNTGVLLLLGLGALLLMGKREKKPGAQGLNVGATVESVSVSLAAVPDKASGDKIDFAVEWEPQTTQGGVAIAWDYRIYVTMGKYVAVDTPAGAVNVWTPTGSTFTAAVQVKPKKITTRGTFTVGADWPEGLLSIGVSITAKSDGGASPVKVDAVWPKDKDFPQIALTIVEKVVKITKPAEEAAVTAAGTIKTVTVSQRFYTVWRGVKRGDGHLVLVPGLIRRRPRR